MAVLKKWSMWIKAILKHFIKNHNFIGEKEWQMKKKEISAFL